MFIRANSRSTILSITSSTTLSRVGRWKANHWSLPPSGVVSQCGGKFFEVFSSLAGSGGDILEGSGGFEDVGDGIREVAIKRSGLFGILDRKSVV